MAQNAPNTESREARERRLDGRMREAESALATMVDSHRRSVKVASLISILVPIFVLIYLSVLYFFVRDFVKPDNLVWFAESQIQQNAPVAFRLLEENAPVVTEEILVQAARRLPELRQAAEDKIVEFSDNYMGQISEDVNTEVARMVRDNKDILNETMKMLTSANEAGVLKHQIKLEVNALIDREKLAVQFAHTKRLLIDVHRKLCRLCDTRKPLSEEQQLERRMVVLAKVLLDYQIKRMK